jgi:uroporphyrinogen III methyltransferase/synthase
VHRPADGEDRRGARPAVDVVAERPSAELLADALAAFGAERAEAMVAAGEPVLRPSQRRPATRRRTT